MKNATKRQRERAKRKRSRKKLTGSNRCEQRLTLNVPEAGQLLGLGRVASYEAVHRGELPVIKIGKRLLVPLGAVEKMLADVKPRSVTGSSETASAPAMAAKGRE